MSTTLEAIDMPDALRSPVQQMVKTLKNNNVQSILGTIEDPYPLNISQSTADKLGLVEGNIYNVPFAFYTATVKIITTKEAKCFTNA